MGRDGVPKRLIQLNAAWPKEWKVGDMDASGNEIATESLTLVCEFVSVIGL
jgi:phage tail-like protein